MEETIKLTEVTDIITPEEETEPANYNFSMESTWAEEIYSGAGAKSGSITPASRVTTLTIDTGITTINGFCIYPATESPLKGRGKTRVSDFFTPNGYYKSCLNITNTSGNGISGDIVTRESKFTQSGTTVTIMAYEDYSYETIEYIWEAW